MKIETLKTLEDALERSEGFLEGFEDDEMQETVTADLEVIRTALGIVRSAIRFVEIAKAG